MMKSKLFWAVVLGALCGGSLASWLSPKMIAWYFDPPAGFGVSCKAPIEWALQKLQIAQLVGTGVGAFFGILFFYMAKSKVKPEEVI